ncbi:hypothetical protein WJX73_002234 [Symbiochloris irregularis]|uniref:Kinesin motor domain-containing protein n=1 Tax=Symbiochloris irregularis TaxID=706552 RepID=A0AAW1PG28_9CHLO
MASAREHVWVSIRVRPLLEAETARQEEECWEASGSGLLRCTQHGAANTALSFDQVFPTDISPDELYAACRERVQSSLQGINSTLFCYGQTGSGKTYTMRQLISLATADIFDTISNLPHREFTLRASALEIYNERVRDLLKNHSENQDLEVQDTRGKVKDLTLQPISSAAGLEQLVNISCARRTTRDTRINVTSSRSHQVIQVHIESRDAHATSPTPIVESPTRNGATEEAEDGLASSERGLEDPRPVTSAVLTFVDLAGSERVSSAALEDSNQRTRLLEGSTINKSLLTLGSVFRALGDASSSASKGATVYVAYRDSKLTRVLKPSLEGKGRLAVVCCISPAAGALDNTRSTLHFAEQARRVAVVPTVNVTVTQAAELRRLRAANAALQKQLDCKQFGREVVELRKSVAQLRKEVTSLGAERDAAKEKVRELEEELALSDASSQYTDQDPPDASSSIPTRPPSKAREVLCARRSGEVALVWSEGGMSARRRAG